MCVPMCMRGAVRPSRCPSSSKQGARENLGHGVPADQDFPMQAGVAAPYCLVCRAQREDDVRGALGETGRRQAAPGRIPCPTWACDDELNNERKSGRCCSSNSQRSFNFRQRLRHATPPRRRRSGKIAAAPWRVVVVSRA